jgi:hypothetical protein
MSVPAAQLQSQRITSAWQGIIIALSLMFLTAIGVLAALLISGAATSAASAAVISPARVAAFTVTSAHRQRTWVVRAGNTLSSISHDVYGNSGCWPGIWSDNVTKIGSNPNVIRIGQRLSIPSQCSYNGPVEVDAVTHSTPAPQPPPPSSSYQTTSAFQACVIRAESGGNPYVWNGSGHWGLYQFSAQTWGAAGGDPGLFGNSGPAYQTQVFWMAYDLWGTSPWAPYDGC